MKHVIVVLFTFFTAICSGQDTGLIIGKIMDEEANNAPLVFANVLVKDVDLKSTSDETGLFLFENLADGKHIVVCSYPGYESKELEVEIVAGQPTEINVALHARRLTLTTVSTTSSKTSFLKKEAKAETTIN